MRTLTKWSIAIGAIVGSAILVWGTEQLLPGTWAVLKAWLLDAGTYLGQTVIIPRWWYWLLCVILVGVMGVAIVAAWRSTFGEGFRKYSVDEFDGILWRWRWSKSAYKETEPYRITPYCLKCDLGLEKNGGGVNLGPGRSPSLLYECSKCLGLHDYIATDRIKERIMKAVRDGTWKKRIKIVKRMRPANPD